MESQQQDPQVATEHREYHMGNRRTLEFLIVAGLIGLGMPIAILMGVRSGEKTAETVYPKTAAVGLPSVDYKSIVMGSPGDEERGHTVFQTNCVACHGPAADGKGP